MRNGSYLRLKNVEIGYTYKVARLFISGQNLFTFSPFKHWDPELGGGKGLTYPNLRSTDGSAYPQMKTFVFGANITF